MSGRRHSVSSWHSLKTQLIVGSVTLLVITLGSISYSLVVHEKQMLTSELEKTVLLQEQLCRCFSLFGAKAEYAKRVES